MSLESNYEIRDGGIIKFESGRMYQLAAAKWGKTRLALTREDGQVLQIDTIDIAADTSRERFLKKAKDALGDAVPAARKELLFIASMIEEILPNIQFSDGAPVDQPYQVNDTGISWLRMVPNRSEPVPVPVTNFGARILEDVQINDGSEDRREFLLDVWQGSMRRKVTLAASDFAAMAWPIKEIGSNAIIYPGAGMTQHAATAIQMWSMDAIKKAVFGHTGWRQLDEGGYGYLTSSGAITADGLRTDVSVHLPPPLDRYRLPQPPTGEQLVAAVRTLLDVLDVAPRAITLPLFCTLLRSVLEPADFVLFVKGSTGQGKTQIVALFQQAFGPTLDAEHLPANFSSTANSLEMTANLVKDAILVIDDFQRNTATNVDAIAERIGRAVGNQSGRARLTKDAQLRQQRPPRGTTVITGEDAPRGQSLRTRMSIVEMPNNGMDWEKLKVAQKQAKAGVYAAALAGYIQWLAADLPGREEVFGEKFEFFRDVYHKATAPHPRTATTAAHLAAALDLFLEFAESIGALTATELNDLTASADTTLAEMIALQGVHLSAADPVEQFMATLDAAIVTGQVYLSNQYGEAPSNAASWGYQKISTGDGYDWRPRGSAIQIGWVADRGVYLNFTAAFGAIQKHAISIGNTIPLTEQTMLKRLDERGLLLNRDDKRETLKVRRKLSGQQQNVIHLAYRVDDSEQQAPLEGVPE